MQSAATDSPLLALLQIVAMLLLSAALGRSLVRSAYVAPSRFLWLALHSGSRAMTIFDLLWLGGAALWLSLGTSSMSELGSEPRFRIFKTAVTTLFVIVGAAQAWLYGVFMPRIRARLDAGPGCDDSDVVTIDAMGRFAIDQHAGASEPALPPARAALAFYSVLVALLVGLLTSIMWTTGAFENGALLIHEVLLAALWASLGVIALDLHMDVWPGTANTERLKRACLYYVRVFEYVKNAFVLLALATVLLLGPLVWLSGGASIAVAAFPIWIAVCLVFATWWNRRLFAQHRVQSSLPLPISRNVYSARDPTWAYFFSTIHVVMFACLVAGIASLN